MFLYHDQYLSENTANAIHQARHLTSPAWNCWADCMLVGAYLTPLVSTRKALRLMNTDYLTAFRTGPLFFFVCNEISYAKLPYLLEIVNHTHAILGSISLIQVVQPDAWKAVATEAVLDSTFRHLLTILDSARDAGFRFETIVTSATGACLLISYIGSAEATVHSAGSDQCRTNRICLY